jgi:epoxyqueuosine reductase QueG
LKSDGAISRWGLPFVPITGAVLIPSLEFFPVITMPNFISRFSSGSPIRPMKQERWLVDASVALVLFKLWLVSAQ